MPRTNLACAGRLAFIWLLALSACGGPKKDETQAPASSAPPSAAAAASPAAAPVGEPPAAVPSHAASAPPANPPPHHVIATVNGKPVLEEKVFALYRMNRQMLQQRGRKLTESDEQTLRSQSLQIAIADELFFQDAVKKGIKVTPAEVDEAIKQLKTRVGSEEAYKKFVADSGFSDIDVRKEIERNLKTAAYRKDLFAGKSVSDDQVKKFYDENLSKGMFNVPENVHVQYIVLRFGPEDSEAVKADGKKKAEEAAKRAKAGEDFTALAKQYSQDPTAERGGDIGFVPRGVMFPKFDELAFSLKPGDVSPAFETPRGYGVLKVLEKRPAATQTYDEVKVALKQDMGRLLEQDAMKEKANALLATAKIQLLDQSYAMAKNPAPQAPQTP